MMTRERLYDYARLMRLNRPIGMLLLLWPALWALWFAAEGPPDVKVFIVFVVGVALMRSAGCVINDYADRNFDPHVERTRNRPLAAGRVAPREAIGLFIGLCIVAFGLVLLMNRLTVMLSFVGVALAVIYPFLKRYTYLPQFYLGFAFGWAIPMAFAAQTGSVPALAWIVFWANVFWCVAYDTEYAMVDRGDDIRIGVKSTAILFGNYDRAMVAMFHALTLATLLAVGIIKGTGLAYGIGLAVAAGFAVYQQWLIRERDRGAYFDAFMNNNFFGAAVFVGLALDYFVKAL